MIAVGGRARSRGKRGILATACLTMVGASAACLGHLPPCPAAGGPAWTELQGAHFRLTTDLDPQEARVVLTDLEHFQAALLAVFGAPPDLDSGRVPVIAVDRGWTDFAAREVGGYFTYTLFQPLAVMRAGGRLASQTVIKHELVHFLSHQIIPHQPPWLSEGLATYYETLEYDEDAGRITVGRPPPGRLLSAQRTGAASIESMFAARKIGHDDTGRFYAAAWITTHYLMNHRQEAMLGYQKALRAGATPEAAWTAAFGSETQAELAAEVRRYVDGGQYALLIYRLQVPALPAPIERRLTDADTHATRALLYLTGSGTYALAPVRTIEPDDPLIAAKRELDETRRQQPDHVMAAAIAHFIWHVPANLAQATRASTTNGNDWRAWLLLAEAIGPAGDQVQRGEAMARALELARADRSVVIETSDLER